jgi:hypothetical protein
MWHLFFCKKFHMLDSSAHRPRPTECLLLGFVVSHEIVLDGMEGGWEQGMVGILWLICRSMYQTSGCCGIGRVLGFQTPAGLYFVRV